MGLDQNHLNDMANPYAPRFGDRVNALITLINELRTDHATNRTNAVETETLIEELAADHATFKTAADQVETLIEELHDDHATFKTAADQVETLIEELHDDHATFRNAVNSILAELKYLCLSKATLAIGASGTTVKTGATVNYLINGVMASKAAFSNGFTASSHDIVALASNINSRVYSLELATGGAVTVNAGSVVAGSGAVAPARGAARSKIGEVKILVASGATPFDATTNSLSAGATHLTVTYTDVAFSIQDLVNPPATITAAKPASAPATLTAAKPASAPATLTAPNPASPAATITAAAVEVLV